MTLYALNAPTTGRPTRCLAMGCQEAVERPEDALGWVLDELFTAGAAWFCPGCSAVRGV